MNTSSAPVSWWLLLLLLSLAGLAGGLALVFVGVRGRKVDDHPLCRRCGFDLTGLPPDSGRCPECGADVRATGAVKVGRRERRRWPVALGLLLSLPSLALMGGVGWAAAGDFDPTPHKPAWWLLREINSPDAPTADAALAELLRRRAAGELAPSAVLGLADKALDRQGDASKPWDMQWGRIVEDARAAGTLDEARWKRYARQAFDFELLVRPTIRQGDPLPVDFSVKTPRLGPNARFYAVYEWKSVDVGGRPASPPPKTEQALNISVSNGGWSRTSGELKIEGDVTGPRAVGPQAVAATVGFAIAERRPNDYNPAPPSPEQTLAAGEASLEGSTAVLPADTLADFVTTDPALADAMRAAVGNVVIRRNGDAAAYYDREERSSIRIEISDLPVALLADIFLRSGGKEIKYGSVHARAKSGNSSYGGSSEKLPDPAAETVDVIFRPDVDRAMRTVEILRPWGEEIVIKDVPVLPPKPVAPAAAPK